MISGGDRMVVTYLRLGLLAIGLALTFGALSVLHYIPGISQLVRSWGLEFTALRPLHTTFAHIWIYAASLAFIYHFLWSQRDEGLDDGDHRRFMFHTAIWVISGAGVFVTLLLGVTSGREYVGFSPLFSILFLSGWVTFAWTFFRYVGPGIWRRPVYVYMWSIGIVYFMYTFLEAHAYLLPMVNRYPLVDLQVQWKAGGTLVGSFNFLVYGSLMYLGERLSGDPRYAQSRTAFLLFGVGCLNSFANFGHHTYHVPQSHFVKWIAFGVSMMEIIIVFRVMSDIVKLSRARLAPGESTATSGFLSAARWWTLGMVFGGVVISVPSWNSLIHGTHVVVGHAMGAEIGIDSMVLFGVVTYLLMNLYRDNDAVWARVQGADMRRAVVQLNAAVVALVAWLMLSGAYQGYLRFNQYPIPAWLDQGRWIFVLTGFVVAVSLVRLLLRWVPLLFGIEKRRERVEVPGLESKTA